MVNTDILSIYYGGVIVFTKETNVKSSPDAIRTYKKGEEVHITPAILYMLGAKHIPEKSIKLVLRTLDQLEDSEVVELSRIVSPSLNSSGLLNINRRVYRQGKGNGYTIEVSIQKSGMSEKSMVINSNYDIAISDIIKPPFDGPPVITQRAANNQIAANRWLVQKHLDIHRLIDKNLATGRKNWDSEGYETPGSPRFK